MKTSLTRSIGFWILVIVSLASIAVGGWLIAGQVGTMTTTLLDGTATGIEVYVGQSLVVVGAVVLGAGLVGILLTLGLIAARTLVPVAAPSVVEVIDGTEQPEAAGTADVADTAESAETAAASAANVSETPPAEDADDAAQATVPETTPSADATQNGSSGSTATATKINVK